MGDENTEVTENANLPKKHRKRNKKLLKDLQQQVEFYFSDPNLTKDKFLKQQISKDPEGYVDVKIIAGFNKMKQMSEDLNLVIKAMKNSSVVEVSSDEKKVRRITALPDEKNVDAETIYVEKLPPYADHDWIKGIFSLYGKVVFVSIPRFKSTGYIKGFAFVEFETAEGANNALKAFSNNTKLEKTNEDGGEQETDPKDRKKEKRTASEMENETNSTEVNILCRKRKRCVSESDVEHTQKLQEIRIGKIKRIRTTSESSADSDSAIFSQTYGKSLLKSVTEERVKDNSDNADKIVDEEKSTEKRNYKRKHSDSQQNIVGEKSSCNTEENDVDKGTVVKAKKAKRRKKKEKKEKKEIKIPPLSVISKKQWLELKQQYKALQKESLRKVKEALKSQSQEKQNSEKQVFSQPIKSQGTHPGSYQNSQDNHQQESTLDQQENKNTLKIKDLPFIPGVVLRFECPPFEMSKEDIKSKLLQFAPVAYLDFQVGANKGFARFHTVENCQSVLTKWHKSDKEAGVCVHKLTDEEEKEYWTKVNSDRQERFYAKRPKQRGADKIAKKAEVVSSHIIFD